MALTLGGTPDQLTVNLTRAARFTATLRSQNQAGEPIDWPDGAVLRLEIERGDQFTQSWTWAIDGPLATLAIPATEVDALPREALSAQLWLDYGQGEFLWCSGRVMFRA